MVSPPVLHEASVLCGDFDLYTRLIHNVGDCWWARSHFPSVHQAATQRALPLEQSAWVPRWELIGAALPVSLLGYCISAA